MRLTTAQFKAYIAVLYYRGVFGDTQIPIEQLWSDTYSTFYRTVMSRNLFQIWSKVLRFDDPVDRGQRKATDTFAAVRNIWTEWNERLRTFYEPGHSITVDEQLVASRNRSRHKIYNPSKPGKYGELIRWCTDAKERYFLYGSPQTKRPQNQVAAEAHKESNKAKNLVMDLCAPFLNSGRNITGDRFFSSYDLACDLLTNHNTTYLGTLHKNRRDIPAILHEPRDQTTSLFAFGGPDGKVTLQSYQVKSNRKVYMISTMHHSGNTLDDQKKKSDLQLYYNETKAGVDVLDEMCKRYTVRCKVLRWPLVHFHNMLDVTGINAFLIFNHYHPAWTTVNVAKRRRYFLHQLALELAQEHMEFRLRDPIGLSTETVRLLCKVTGQDNPRPSAMVADAQPPAMGRCACCKDEGKVTRACNKASHRCSSCGKPICGRHGVPVAVRCPECL